MDFKIPSHATQPLRDARSPAAPAARRTAPLETAPEGGARPPRESRRLAAEQPAYFRSEIPLEDPWLEATPEFQALKARGKLTPEVLAQLQALSTQPLADGINRRTLLASALRELADPEGIAQGDRHTCAAAVVQAKLAQDDPGEYLRLLSGLASPRGEVTLANGDTMRRDADWQVDSGRSLTGDLMQPAFMQYATGSYDSRTDTRATADGRGKGLYAAEQTQLLNALSGKQNATVFGNGPKVVDAMQKALDKGQTVPVVLMVRDRQSGQLQGHSVLVERIQDGRVTFLDPRGQRQTVSLEAFTARLQSASLPKALVSASLLKSSEGKKGELAGWPEFLGAIGHAFQKHVVEPAVAIVKPIVQPVVDHIVRPVVDHIVRPVVDNIIRPAWEKGVEIVHWTTEKAVEVVQWAWEKSVEVANWANTNKDMLMSLTAIACAVIPGLQIVALILAAVSAIDSAKELYGGIKTGDWKLALKGAAKLFAVLAAAIGGPILSKAIGAGANGLARLADGLSRLANGLSDLMDVFDDKLDAKTRLGRLLSFLAKGVGGSSAALGERFEQAAANFTTVADKASRYYDRSTALYEVLASGPFTLDSGVAAFSESLSLAGDLHSDHANRDNLRFEPGQEKGRKATYQFKSRASYVATGYAVGKSLMSGDLKQLPGALQTSAGLAGQLNKDVRNNWEPDVDPTQYVGKDVGDRLSRSAEYFEQGQLALNGDTNAQANAAWAIAQKATEDTGFDWSGVPGVPWIQERKETIEKWGEDSGLQAEQWTQDRLKEAQRWWDDQQKEQAR